MSSSSSLSSKKCMMIGMVGFRSFAQFLAKNMIKQGHTITATSRSDYSHLCAHLGVSFFADPEAFLGAVNDVVLICTSIMSSSQVLKSMPLQCLRRPTLFVDVFSVLPEECDVLCTHPMFGPESGKNGWENLTFVYERVRIRNQQTCSSFLQIFETEGCRMVEMACEEHDKLAAKSQFLTHTIGSQPSKERGTERAQLASSSKRSYAAFEWNLPLLDPFQLIVSGQLSSVDGTHSYSSFIFF